MCVGLRSGNQEPANSDACCCFCPSAQGLPCRVYAPNQSLLALAPLIRPSFACTAPYRSVPLQLDRVYLGVPTPLKLCDAGRGGGSLVMLRQHGFADGEWGRPGAVCRQAAAPDWRLLGVGRQTHPPGLALLPAEPPPT